MRNFKWIAMISFAIIMLSLPIFAEEQLYSTDDFDLNSVIDTLPEDVKRLLPNEDIFSSERVLDNYGIDFFGRTIGKLFAEALNPALKSFTVTVSLLVISSVLTGLRGMVKGDSLSELFDFVSGLCIMLTQFELISSLFVSVQSYLNTLTAVMHAMLGVITAVAVSGGNLSSSAVSSGGLLVSLDLIEVLAAKGLMPILQLCFGLTIASGLNSSVKLSGLTKLIRDLFSWVVGLIAAGISTIMSFQNSIAAGADSISVRAIKFAASNLPIAGTIAGEAVRMVAGSLSVVRGTVGWVGIVIILLLTIPIIFRVLLTKLGIAAAEIIAGIIGSEREKNLLSEISGLLGFLSAICVISALMLIYSLTVFARGSVALSG